MKTATVFVGNRLAEEQFQDDRFREEALEDAVRAIESNIEGVHVMNRNRLFCSMTIAGSPESIAEVETYLARTGLGHMDSGAEHSALRAAPLISALRR